MKTKKTKGRIVRRARKSYRRANLVPEVKKQQVEFLADASLCMTFKRRFFKKLTAKENITLRDLLTGLYTLGFQAAGGEVK